MLEIDNLSRTKTIHENPDDSPDALRTRILEAAREASLKSGAESVFEVEIEGMSPLLQDKFPDERFSELELPSMIVHGRKPDPDYAKSLFLDENGLICEPANHLEGAMAQAAGESKVKGSRMKTYRRGFKASVFVQPELIPHGNQCLEKLTTPIPNGKGGRTLKTYPKLESGWNLKFYIQVHDEQIQPSVVKEVLENAGKRFGIGAWRPRHGRFHIVSWKEI